MGSLSKLQNGSDVRGVALEVEGGAPVNLTPEIAGRIAAAFVRWLADKRGKAAHRRGTRFPPDRRGPQGGDNPRYRGGGSGSGRLLDGLDPRHVLRHRIS